MAGIVFGGASLPLGRRYDAGWCRIRCRISYRIPKGMLFLRQLSTSHFAIPTALLYGWLPLSSLNRGFVALVLQSSLMGLRCAACYNQACCGFIALLVTIKPVGASLRCMLQSSLLGLRCDACYMGWETSIHNSKFIIQNFVKAGVKGSDGVSLHFFTLYICVCQKKIVTLCPIYKQGVKQLVGKIRQCQ